MERAGVVKHEPSAHFANLGAVCAAPIHRRDGHTLCRGEIAPLGFNPYCLGLMKVNDGINHARPLRRNGDVPMNVALGVLPIERASYVRFPPASCLGRSGRKPPKAEIGRIWFRRQLCA